MVFDIIVLRSFAHVRRTLAFLHRGRFFFPCSFASFKSSVTQGNSVYFIIWLPPFAVCTGQIRLTRWTKPEDLDCNTNESHKSKMQLEVRIIAVYDLLNMIHTERESMWMVSKTNDAFWSYRFGGDDNNETRLLSAHFSTKVHLNYGSSQSTDV